MRKALVLLLGMLILGCARVEIPEEMPADFSFVYTLTVGNRLIGSLNSSGLSTEEKLRVYGTLLTYDFASIPEDLSKECGKGLPQTGIIELSITAANQTKEVVGTNILSCTSPHSRNLIAISTTLNRYLDFGSGLTGP